VQTLFVNGTGAEQAHSNRNGSDVNTFGPNKLSVSLLYTQSPAQRTHGTLAHPKFLWACRVGVECKQTKSRDRSPFEVVRLPQKIKIKINK
jgi:hypothetical protein